MPCLCSIAPLPGSHCSVVIILYPGDLLKALGQKIRTSIRHADPQTVKEWHRDEAIRVLKFLREAVLAELRRDGRKWEWAKPSEEEVHERLADCDHPLRDKVPNAVRDGDARFGLLAMSALLWAVRRMDLLTGGLRRSVTSMDKVYVSELKKLRTDMVAWIKKLVARKRAGQVGVAADACDDDGEKVHSAFQAVGVARTVADAPAGAAETGERSMDVENEGLAEGKGAMSADLEKEKEEVGVEAAHRGSGNVVVSDRKEGVDVEAVGQGDNATATK
ncbi:unnamed protein product [Closterium sp. NIES-64]|nr:unnamed protein product [Closterium sp. NIES-64]